MLKLGYNDCIYTHCTITLSFIDRVKVLLGWGLKLRVETQTEHLPGKVEASTEVSVVSPFPPRKGRGGMEVGATVVVE